MKKYTTINGFTVWAFDYKKAEGYKVNALMAEGMCMRFARWLNENDILEDTAEEVYNNTSGMRGGNRLDIFDDYSLTEDGRYTISYIWAEKNSIVYAAVYDNDTDSYIGHIEI